MRQKIGKVTSLFFLLISAGIFLRFFAMSLGHNYDWESYCIVGEIAGNFRNVYAETGRYNYGMLFFCIQGLLWRIACFCTSKQAYELTYRVLMVSVLTATDLGITQYIAKRHSMRAALVFFLNPISILITGYHNQFDNIAVLLALMTVAFYNEEERYNKKDIGFVLMLTLCLIMKHILFIFPLFLLLRKALPGRKKLLYAFVPPALFLLSFVPFVVGNAAALRGVIDAVFLYRSFNNAPLLMVLYKLIGFPEGLKFPVYLLLMAGAAWLTRKLTYEKQLLLYLIAMVAFSSAIANQYLAIPMAALCILDLAGYRYLYMLLIGLHMILSDEGLQVLRQKEALLPAAAAPTILNYFTRIGYVAAAWILFLAFLHVLRAEDRPAGKAA